MTHATTTLGLLEETATAELWRPDETGAILRHQLGALLSVELGQAGVMSSISASVAAGAMTPPPLTFKELLLHEKPARELLVAVKEYAKRMKAAGILPPDVAVAVYFLAIAAARSRLAERITSLSDDQIACGMKWLRSRLWIANDLKEILNPV